MSSGTNSAETWVINKSTEKRQSSKGRQ